MKKILLFLSTFQFSVLIFSQGVLKSSIGLSALPGDNTSICTPTCSSSYNFDTDGYLVGDTIPDFSFYTLAGTPYNAQTLINSGKPLCIVAGSYTCPVWRGKIDSLNMLISKYGSKVNFMVVYVCEAHPKSPDISPYSCAVWDPNPSTVKYLQPTTYGQRKATCTDMVNNTCGCMQTVNCPIVIDGPCNEFWTHFGPAPNNAYLINPKNGTVYCKHGWFDKAPNTMSPCIDQLLAITSGVNEQSAESTISVYPNPFSEKAVLRITNRSRITNCELKIYDLVGKEMNVDVIRNSDEFVIRRSNLVAGIYFYKLLNENETISTGKLVIE